MRTRRLTTPQKQEIFQDLVLTQDMVTDVPRSKQIIVGKYEISEEQLRLIEEEGLDNEWPPLSEAPQKTGVH
jgi:hypothetical protein